MPVQYFTNKNYIKSPLPSFKVCEVCGKEFRPSSNRNKMCGRKCWNQRTWARKYGIPIFIPRWLDCKKCGTQFLQKQRKSLYCSPRCRDNWQESQRIRRSKLLTQTQASKIMGEDEKKITSKKEPKTRTDHPGSPRVLRGDELGKQEKVRQVGSLADGEKTGH